MAEKLIVIVGMTGNQGGSVVDVYINQSGRKIRGISRDPTKESSRGWSDRGVEMMAADVDDVAGLKEVFKGAQVIFGKWSQRNITRNLHFNAKWKAVEYMRENYPELDEKTSLLQVAFFFMNMGPGREMCKLHLLLDGDAKFPMVDPHLDRGHFTKALPRKNKVQAKFERIAREELEKLLLPGVGEELAGMFQYIGEFGYDGSDPSIAHPKDLGVEVPVTTVEAWIKMQDWSGTL
ncbi:NAD(P)-binding protein [Saccharata proteae CBS 121410]|uniref:NAD(P)-binding protein n=1 Tax=Saccharata proteae CBS 121410 TaxID=1314787 RepID=A0A9P4HU38_9PEZI|nr:NAD(P)-binding protein [Saccharata proteae CBS 121410]